MRLGRDYALVLSHVFHGHSDLCLGLGGRRYCASWGVGWSRGERLASWPLVATLLTTLTVALSNPLSSNLGEARAL